MLDTKWCSKAVTFFWPLFAFLLYATNLDAPWHTVLELHVSRLPQLTDF